jgi:predicted dehydrogenase
MITFVTGLRMTEVLADLRTFLPVRQKPPQSVQTFNSKTHMPSAGLEQRISTEDYASVLLRLENGVRGVVTVSQVSAGHTNRLCFEINGSTSSLAWNSERPNELWTGHRDRANEDLLKDPSLLAPSAKALASYPGGHDEGYPDTFQQLFRKVYAYIESGSFSAKSRTSRYSAESAERSPANNAGRLASAGRGERPERGCSSDSGEHGTEYRPDFPTFEDGHYGMLLCDAIAESARCGRWTQVEI